MQADRAWDRIVDAIDTKYGLTDHGRSERAIADAPELTEHVSYVVFERDGQRYKLERVQGPAIVNRKTVGARRAGATVRHTNIYDPDEVSFRTSLYRQTTGEGEWESLDPAALGL